MSNHFSDKSHEFILLSFHRFPSSLSQLLFVPTGAHPAPGVAASAFPSSLGAVAQRCRAGDLRAGPAGVLPKGTTRFALPRAAALP